MFFADFRSEVTAKFMKAEDLEYEAPMHQTITVKVWECVLLETLKVINKL